MAAQDQPTKPEPKAPETEKKWSIQRKSVNLTHRRTDGYPLDTCVVSGKPLPAAAVAFQVGEQPIKVCSDACRGKVELDPQAYAKKLAEAVIAVHGPAYPMSTCPISRKPLGAQGEPVPVVLGNTLVKLCSEACRERLAMRRRGMPVTIDAAVAEKSLAPYAPTACPVCDSKLTEQASWAQHGTALLKLCGEECFTKFALTPNTYVSKWRAAASASAPAPGDVHKAADPKASDSKGKEKEAADKGK
jgi:hypothetical protein